MQPGSPPVEASSARTGTNTGEETVAVPQGPGRFLNGMFGRDSDWMLVPAAVSFGGILVARRHQPRTDALRAAAVLWGVWLVFTWCFFASSNFINSYYLAAFAPPIAALCGMGLALAWRLRAKRATRVVVLGTVVGGTAYALYLLPADAGVGPWVWASTLALALAAVAVLAWSLLSERATGVVAAGVALSAIALLLGSAWASGTVVTAGQGPFDSAYQSAALNEQEHSAHAARPPPCPGRCAGRSQGRTVRQRGHQRDVRRVERGHLRHRAGIPPGGRLQRAGAEHDAGAVRRRRARRSGHGGAGRDRAAHPQPRHAVDHRALPTGAHAR